MSKKTKSAQTKHINVSDAVFIIFYFNNEVSNMTLVEQLAMSASGEVDLTYSAVFKGIKATTDLIADGMAKGMDISHYLTHLNGLNFWLNLTAKDQKQEVAA